MVQDDEEERAAVHRRVEVEQEDNTVEERDDGQQQRPSRRVVLVPQGRLTQSGNRYEALGESDTESVLEEPHRNSNPVQEFPDSHDVRLARVRNAVQQGQVPNRRLRLLWNPEMDLAPEVRVAANLLRTLATRIGAVPQGSVMPGCIRRQRWSPFNVPLMWAAAEQGHSVRVANIHRRSCRRASSCLWREHIRK